MSEIVCEETTRGWDKKITYSDGTTAIVKENIRGNKEITYTKNNEEIAKALTRDTVRWTQIIKTEYKDGGSSTTIHNANALLWPENITFRDGKTTNESCHNGIINHMKENNTTHNHQYNEADNSNRQWENHFSKNKEYWCNEYENRNAIYYNREMQEKREEEERKRREIIQGKINKIKETQCEYELSLMIYQEKEYPEVQLEAIKKLKALEKRKGSEYTTIVFSFNEYNPIIRYEIFKDIKDIPERGKLGYDCDYIARHDPDATMRLEALKRLNKDDFQQTFGFIAGKDENLQVQLEAIKKIKIPSSSEYQENRHTIYSKLERIAEGSIRSNLENRKEALKRIIDEEALYSIAKNDYDESFCLLALNQIKNKEYIEKLRYSSKHRSIRKNVKHILNAWNERFKPNIIKSLIRRIIDTDW